MSEPTSTRFDLANAMDVLERTPGAFRALLAGLPEAWTAPNEGPETFSAFDNLGHLVHGERTDWIPRARIILEHGRARPFDPFDRFAQTHESRGKSVHDLGHLAQTSRVMAKQYRDDVGPWRAYLPIVDR